MRSPSRSPVVFSALVAALGGLLFGFDTAVISGTTEALQRTFALGEFGLGFAVASALIGTIVGAFAAGRPAERFGRKPVLFVLAVLYFVASIGSALAASLTTFVIFRFIGGLAVGGASVVSPLYIAEIAPARQRGRLVALNQLNVVGGILLAFLSNFLLARVVVTDAAWRWMLGVQAFPAALFFVLLFFIPESPRWLIKRGRVDEARAILTRIEGSAVEHELEDIMVSVRAEVGHREATLFQRRYARPIFLAWTVAMFNQLSGINALMYYAPRIFRSAGAAAGDALLQAVAIGGTNLLFTALALFIIDRFGRRPLLALGGLGAAVSLALTAVGFYRGGTTGHLVLAGLLGFIAFHAIGQGAVIWVFISEIFPNAVREKGQALGSFTHWFMAAVVSWTFPVVAEASGGLALSFFATMMLLQFVFAWKIMPETRGLSLEELQHRLGIATSAPAVAAMDTGRHESSERSANI
ncbi:MAG TPA: sugar porter family MFS transporter, partial [Gemmatimonadaceae bacterium]